MDKRVLIVSTSDKFNFNILKVLSDLDVSNVDHIKHFSKSIQDEDYDLVIVHSPSIDELQAIYEMNDSSDAGIIIFTKDEEGIDPAVMTVNLPSSTSLISFAVLNALKAAQRLKRKSKKEKDLNDAIEELKLENRAKWALINCLGMDEERAHYYIEKQAMTLRISKKEVSQNIINTYL